MLGIQKESSESVDRGSPAAGPGQTNPAGRAAGPPRAELGQAPDSDGGGSCCTAGHGHGDLRLRDAAASLSLRAAWPGRAAAGLLA